MKKGYFLLMLPAIVMFGCTKTNNSGPAPQLKTANYAGSGTAGLLNGPVTTAKFQSPVDIAVDAYGDVFVSDQGNNVIRKITTAGQVITYAGSGYAGFRDGDATTAEFNNPQGLVLDNGGNLYVADAGNNRIRKIDTKGNVTTFAGDGGAGHVDATGIAAEFSAPVGLAIDASLNIYVTDSGNNMIRKITTAGVVTTFAGTGAPGMGNGSRASATFNSPSGIAIDNTGDLFIAEAGNNLVRKITPADQVSSFATVTGPQRLAVDFSGNVFISTSDNFIKKATIDGVVTTYAGNGTHGFANDILSASEFASPMGVFVSGTGVLLVADSGNNLIRIITLL